MAVTTKVTKCKVTLTYEKAGSSSYSVDSLADNQVLFDTASLINSLQDKNATGIYKTTEMELISA